MINQKQADILNYLIKRSPSNNFIVIEPDEILENVDKSIDKDELMQLLTDLGSREALTIRIMNLNECVLAPTPKAKVLIDELKEMEEAKNIISTVAALPKEVEQTEQIDEPAPKVSFINRFRKNDSADSEAMSSSHKIKVVVNYKKIYLASFLGAFCGGGLIGIIMLIIGVVG